MKDCRIMLGLGVALAVLIGGTGRAHAATPENPFGIHLERLRFGLTGVHDDNIDHESIAVESYGVVAAVDARVLTHHRAPYVSFRYAGGYQSFSNSNRWDRWQNAATLGTRIPLGGEFRFESALGYDSRVSTEDRELVNQWTFRPEVRVDPGPWTLSVEGGYRSRHYTGNAAYDEDIRMITTGVAFEFQDRDRLGLAYRYEDANSVTGSRSYTRDRLRFRNELDVARDHTFLLFAERQWRDYPGDLVSGDPAQPRRDRRWVLQAEWVYEITARQDLALQYEFEERTSNDPREAYKAQRLEFRIRWDLTD